MTELPSAYIAKDHESRMYELWEKADAFSPKEKGEPFSILMPPPNANESLHIGHALMVTTEDVMIRFARMQGKRALWVPGTDHAGFETQVVYEKKLQKEGKSRFDFTPDELREHIRAYVDEQRSTIIAQFRALGTSADWSKLYFTLDQPIIDTVYTTFKKMHQDGLLYRAKRLVNYCTKHGTSFSDLEVEYEDREGELVYIKYPYVDNPNEHIVVATTRPETMLGDTGVAVHPNDKRYTAPSTVTVPLVNRVVPVVGDKVVDPQFGTGAVKVTPAHSSVDNTIATDHQLPSIEVIDTHGRIIDLPEIPKELHGLKTLQARKKIIEMLRGQGLIEKIEPLEHRVGVCYKCRTAIEILPLDQWWVKTKPLAEKALLALRKNEITITPRDAKKNLVTWLENIVDWNISRQIVWGIPIPAWINEVTGEVSIEKQEGKDWHQDSDTFDTWFSSSQLPYAALGYPKSATYTAFYPTSVMETAGEILYWWVARMIMMSLYVTGKVPFNHIYLHGLIVDEQGKKMSKSKGNVVNPLELMEQYGTDALRWAVTHGTSPGQNFNMTIDRVVGGRNLANKLWNASRFVLMQLENSDFKNLTLKIKNSHKLINDLSSVHHKSNQHILEQLNQTVDAVTKRMQSDQYGLATDLLHDFFWHTFCDQYLEQSKTLLHNQKTAEETSFVLLHSLQVTLRLFHPFMPFCTETIWQELYARKLVHEPLLIETTWPNLT